MRRILVRETEGESPNLLTFKEPKNRFQEIDSASPAAGYTITLFVVLARQAT
jgi:hypothetical protein